MRRTSPWPRASARWSARPRSPAGASAPSGGGPRVVTEAQPGSVNGAPTAAVRIRRVTLDAARKPGSTSPGEPPAPHRRRAPNEPRAAVGPGPGGGCGCGRSRARGARPPGRGSTSGASRDPRRIAHGDDPVGVESGAGWADAPDPLDWQRTGSPAWRRIDHQQAIGLGRQLPIFASTFVLATPY